MDAGENKIVAYLNVPGIVENRPMICIGDLVELRFRTAKVIGEVGEVQVKMETIMLVLPTPALRGSSYFSALKYSKAILKTETEIDSSDLGCFDVRFGLFRSRAAHDTFMATASSALSDKFDQVVCVIAPIPFLHNITKEPI